MYDVLIFWVPANTV